jgi:general secretion pathway protein F
MQFDVHALDGKQQVVALTLEAASEAIAREMAANRGLSVFSVEQRGGKRLSVRMTRKSAFKPILFSIELLSLLDAGLNLVEAMQTLAEKEAAGERLDVLSGMLAAIHRGEPFSKAVAAFPQHFSPLYVATIKASERTGNVKEALSRYIAYQEEFDRVRKKVISASIYPVILMLVGVLVLGFLMFYVVPRFASVYEDMSGTLPFFSQLVLGFGSFVGKHGFFLFSAFILAFGSAAYALSRASVRSGIMQRVWRMPALGERMKVYQLARLYRTAGMLMRAGIPAVKALEMVEDLLAAHLRPQLRQARTLIEEGHPMSAALGAAGLATPVAGRMMLVGERSGDMGHMLGQIARFHDDEVARFVDWFTRAFEPVLMAVLGVAVGGVVVLMYMPIFELAGNIK